MFDGPPDFVWYYRSNSYYDDDYNTIYQWTDDAMLFDHGGPEGRWWLGCVINRYEMRTDWVSAFSPSYAKAVLAARQARFEHGDGY